MLMSWLASYAQVVFTGNSLPDNISVLDKASIADAGKLQIPFEKVKKGTSGLEFNRMSGRLGNLGFTSSTYWVTFDIRNEQAETVKYYLETAEPVTDNVNLYLVSSTGPTTLQRTGDNLDFSDRAVPNRRSMFSIIVHPGETKQAFMEVRNDGEKNNLPLKLIKPSRLLEQTYGDQLAMGLFFGILVVIAITYLFFFFALKEKSFLHYSLYVIFMGLCQFALDGYYHQYIGTGDGWLNRHMVIITAILSCFFFGNYSVTVLELKEKNKFLYKFYDVLFTLLGATLAGVIFMPSFLEFSYPVINLLTIGGIFLIFATVITMAIRGQYIDKYYLGGIAILFVCIALAVSMNFGIFPEDFSTDNITKPGIALEVIALSLSMANRIKVLKTKKEELQAVALQKSEEMNDIKSYFLKNMSHELRTPLNAILGIASAMEQESDDPKVRENCEVIRYASHGLISSVNDILDFGRIEKGELRLEKREFSPREKFEKLRLSMRKQIEDKGLDFTFECDLADDLIVWGDPVRLEQMVYNLLGNACKFTAAGSVGFSIKSQEKNGKLVLSIVISDTGVGIAKEKLESVFGLFSQSDRDNKRKFGGFGIGLSIVKALVDLHRGKIILDSIPGKGTTCTLRLEYGIAEAAKAKIAETVAEAIVASTPKRNILIVEDNAMNQMVIKMMLKPLPDVTFSVANDGAECLEMMKNEAFGLVLMDLQMPVMDGYEAMEAIRKGETGSENSNVPIIVITADVTEDTKQRVFEIGANDYMTKPVDKKSLHEKIDLAFSGKLQPPADQKPKMRVA